MAEYIEREALLNEIAELHMKHKLADNEEMLFTGSDIRGLVMCLPAAEVEPVGLARWIPEEKNDVYFTCSYCGCEICTSWDYDDLEWNFCPNCGARMDLGGTTHAE